MPDLTDKSIEDVLNEVQGLAAMASQGQVKSVAALVARCTVEVANTVRELSNAITVTEQRLGGGVAELVTQIDAARRDLQHSATTSAQQTRALVRWTKVLAFTTAAYALLTGLLLVASLKS